MVQGSNFLKVEVTVEVRVKLKVEVKVDVKVKVEVNVKVNCPIILFRGDIMKSESEFPHYSFER